MAIDIVDFPINSMVIFDSYVSLPEGTPSHHGFQYSYSILECSSGWLGYPHDLGNVKSSRPGGPQMSLHLENNFGKQRPHFVSKFEKRSL